MGQKTFDVAIVGGGIAGLYAAWRLQEAWKSKDSQKELAKRLSREPEGILNVVILEQDPVRLGGRLRSAELPFAGGSVIAEVGAMRFTTRHRLLRRLLEQLEVETVPFEGNGFSTRYYLRGKHFGAADIEHHDKENFPYHFREEEERKSPASLLSHVLECTLRELSLDENATPETLLVLEKLRGKLSREGMTHHEWEEIRKHGLVTGTVRLHNIGMWNLIHHYLGSEAAHFVEDGFGYESIIGNWNVSDAIPWFISDFSPGQTYETVVKGFSHVVNCLAKKFKQGRKDGDSFQCSMLLNTRATKLRKVDPPEDMYELSTEKMYPEYRYKYERTEDDLKRTKEERQTQEELKNRKNRENVKDKEEDEDSSSIEQFFYDTTKRTIRAKIIILALPKRPLEQLTIDDSVLKDEESRKDWNIRLNEVLAHRLAKIVQGYRHAWWRRADTPKGAGSRIFTDLPLRQAYYFDREWLEERGRYQYYDKDGNLKTEEEKGHHEKRKPEIEGMIVAYLDGHHASFWRFITAVSARLRDAGHRKRDPDKSMDDEKRVKLIQDEERVKREVFGDRIWAWSIPGEMSPSMEKLKKTAEKFVEDWSDEERARHLYFYRHGLYERASTKMSHILKDLHPFSKREIAEIPAPVAGAYTFWENFGERYEAGWHTWEPGVDSTTAMEYMVQPFEEKNDPEPSKDESGPKPFKDEKESEHRKPRKGHKIYVCGEAYSFEQGWIEGALKSVEMVMDRLGVMLPGEELAAKTPEARKRSEEIRDYVGLDLRQVAPLLSPYGSVAVSDDQSLVFISGQIGFEVPLLRKKEIEFEVPRREPLPSFEHQAREALRRLREEMNNAGGEEFVHIRVFLQSMAYYDKFNQIYEEEWKKYAEERKKKGGEPEKYPARAAIAVNALPFGALVELDAVAKKKDKGRQK